MKIGILLNANEPETVWNTFRFGVKALANNRNVKIFLLGKGIKSEDTENKKFNVKEQINHFIKNKGQILACGTCLKIRQKEESNVCSISTMDDMLKLVEESDKILTFG